MASLRGFFGRLWARIAGRAAQKATAKMRRESARGRILADRATSATARSPRR